MANVEPSSYEKNKRRMTFDTMQKMGGEVKEASDAMLQWFKENIHNIALFCFSRGLAKESSDWAHYVWYVNTVDPKVQMDELFDVNWLAKLMESHTDNVSYGQTRGGTTIQLPFGFVQWHFPGEKTKRAEAEARGENFKTPGCLQFHHSYNKLHSLFASHHDSQVVCTQYTLLMPWDV